MVITSAKRIIAIIASEQVSCCFFLKIAQNEKNNNKRNRSRNSIKFHSHDLTTVSVLVGAANGKRAIKVCRTRRENREWLRN